MHRSNDRGSPTLFSHYQTAFVIFFSLVALEIMGAAIAGRHYLGIPFGHVFEVGDVTLGLSGWLLIPLSWLLMVAISLVKRQSNRPTKAIWRTIYFNRMWLIRGALLSVVQIPFGRAFATLKSTIPSVNPFGWDRTFATVDRDIFGTDAWRITHSVIGDAGTLALDRAYALWTIYIVLLAGWIAFTRNKNVQIKAALAFNLSWLLLGVILATVFASAGPCFVEAFHHDPTFRPLMDELQHAAEPHGLFALQAMRFLQANFGSARFGVGISAMPSMHLSMATLGVVLTFASGAKTWVKLLSISFALTIMIGSVHLGWHYAVDGIVSVLVTVAVWYLCSGIIEATRQSL